jgi:hypothetical protein
VPCERDGKCDTNIRCRMTANRRGVVADDRWERRHRLCRHSTATVRARKPTDSRHVATSPVLNGGVPAPAGWLDGTWITTRRVLVQLTMLYYITIYIIMCVCVLWVHIVDGICLRTDYRQSTLLRSYFILYFVRAVFTTTAIAYVLYTVLVTFHY